MEIKLLISGNGDPVLICEGKLERSVYAVELDCVTRLLALHFYNTKGAVQLDCPVDEDLAAHMLTREYCAIGCMQNGKLADAVAVPLYINQGPQEALRD